MKQRETQLVPHKDRRYEPIENILWWSSDRLKWWKLVKINEKHDVWELLDDEEIEWYFGMPDPLFDIECNRLKMKHALLKILKNFTSKQKAAEKIGINQTTLAKFLKGEKALSKKAPALKKIEEFIQRNNGKILPFHYW